MGQRTVGIAARMAKYTQAHPDGCWEWTGYKIQGGYGHISVNTAEERAAHKSNLAHRISYELHIGPIEEGLTIDHLCRNPGCVRPDHLEAVTIRENIRRGSAANKTHCVNGHEYTAANTYIMPSGYRDCRRCIYLRHRKRYDRKKAEKA